MAFYENPIDKMGQKDVSVAGVLVKRVDGVYRRYTKMGDGNPAYRLAQEYLTLKKHTLLQKVDMLIDEYAIGEESSDTDDLSHKIILAQAIAIMGRQDVADPKVEEAILRMLLPAKIVDAVFHNGIDFERVLKVVFPLFGVHNMISLASSLLGGDSSKRLINSSRREIGEAAKAYFLLSEKANPSIAELIGHQGDEIDTEFWLDCSRNIEASIQLHGLDTEGLYFAHKSGKDAEVISRAMEKDGQIADDENIVMVYHPINLEDPWLGVILTTRRVIHEGNIRGVIDYSEIQNLRQTDGKLAIHRSDGLVTKWGIGDERATAKIRRALLVMCQAVSPILQTEMTVSSTPEPSTGESSAEEENETILCPHCGATLPKQAKFCFECGTRMEKPRPSICPECGAKLIAGARFCMECGKKLTES